MTALRIADDLALPPEAITQTFAICAVRGSGKAYTAAVLVEEMGKAALPVAVVDPIDVWCGLRASANGTGPGLPVVVFGGDPAGLLDAGAGEAVADDLVDLRPPAVIDLSHLRKGEQQRSVTQFAERLYHRNRHPLHLVLDEADAWAPQRPVKGTERLLGAVEDLVRPGRARGLGVTLITQRPAVLHKDVLTQIQVLVCLRMVAPHDRTAIDEWVRIHGKPEQRDELVSSLPSLPVGEAWVWSPGWLDLFKRVRIHRRETFDSSATPKVGERRAEPRRLAPVDLAALRDSLAAAISRAEEEDPKALRRRIAELERQLATARKGAEPERVIERVEVPAVSEEAMGRLEEGTAKLLAAVRTLEQTLDPIRAEIHETAIELRGAVTRAAAVPLPLPGAKVRPGQLVVTPPKRAPSKPVEKREAVDAPRTSAYARILLETMTGRHPMRLTRNQIAVLSGRRPRSSSYQAALAELKRGGLVEEEGGSFALTPAGVAAAGTPIGPESGSMLETWLAALPKAEAALLRAIADAHPRPVTRDELSQRTGYSKTSSSFPAAIGSLRRNGLAESNGHEVWAAEALFLGGEA